MTTMIKTLSSSPLNPTTGPSPLLTAQDHLEWSNSLAASKFRETRRSTRAPSCRKSSEPDIRTTWRWLWSWQLREITRSRQIRFPEFLWPGLWRRPIWSRTRTRRGASSGTSRWRRTSKDIESGKETSFCEKAMKHAASVTRFGEILPLGQTIKILWQIFEGLFSVGQNFEPTLAN